MYEPPLHKLGWSLHMLRGNLLCKLGKYPHQYQPGHCGWCGKPHVGMNREQTQKYIRLNQSDKMQWMSLVNLLPHKAEQMADHIEGVCNMLEYYIQDSRIFGDDRTVRADDAIKYARQDASNLREKVADVRALHPQRNPVQIVREPSGRMKIMAPTHD